MLKLLLSLLVATNLNADPLLLNTQTSILDIMDQPRLTIEFKDTDLLTVAPPPPKLPLDKKPNIEATSALILDIGSNTLLYEKNIHEKLPIASLTKIMTALIILTENNLNDIVTIDLEAAQIEGSKIWLYEGEQITVENLLKATLIHSANDATFALAKFNAGSIQNFTNKMNDKAKLLGLKNSHFSHPAGFDVEENYSTTYDLSILAVHVLKNEFIRNTVNIQSLEITSTNGKTVHKLENTNILLKETELNITGLKTGSTPKAGECLIAIANQPNGQQTMTIVLNSPARFTESKNMIKWVFEQN